MKAYASINEDTGKAVLTFEGAGEAARLLEKLTGYPTRTSGEDAVSFDIDPAGVEDFLRTTATLQTLYSNAEDALLDAEEDLMEDNGVV